MRRPILLIAFCLCLQVIAVSQKTAGIERTNEEIIIDGQLDESSWAKPKPADDFWQYFPSDTSLAENQSEIYFLYDEKNLYIGIKCLTIGNDFVIPSLKRDFRASGNDNMTLLIDPFNDRINAFMFGTNPAGVQREGLISGGGNDIQQFATSWDNKWKCEAKIFDNYWIAEMAIPLSILRFKPGIDEWGFNAYRFDIQTNERSTWSKIPLNQIIFNLAFNGKLQWDMAPESTKGGGNAIIPYLTTGRSRDFEKKMSGNSTFNVGGDAKIAVTPSLNLDLTFNPDFSQVEVDEQVTNVDRFEIFFPERRQFFVENADLFGSFGDSRINPFFSRRIGVSRDTVTGNAIQNTIYAGARLSGKINKNTRLGLLTMQTAADPENGLPDYNYSIFSFQKKVFSRSNFGLIFVNKQAFGDIEKGSGNDRFNRVLRLDYNLATDDNKWIGKAFLHRSLSVENGKSPWAQGSSLFYNIRNFSIGYEQQYVGEDYDAQVGFVRRRNYIDFNPQAAWTFYPKESIINNHSPQIEWRYLQKLGIGNTDTELNIEYEIKTTNNVDVGATITNTYVYLLRSFDPTGTKAEPLEAETDYTYTNFEMSFRSNSNLDLSMSLNPNLGQYFNGSRYGLRGSFNYRWQPYVQLELSYNYNHFSLDHLSDTRQTMLLSPRVDISFNKSIFLSTIVQYNSQIENMNVNARFQWRFAPVSDLYIVYTDNYFSDITDDPSNRFITNIRNRSLVAKVSYWLNI